MEQAKTKGKALARVGGWFREMKSELKKVVWPTFSKVRQNTLIVLIYVLLVGLVIWILDWLFAMGMSFIVNR